MAGNRPKITVTEYLEKAVALIIDLTEANGDICERLHEIPYEAAICARHCTNLDEFCVKRYLKYYKTKNNGKIK